MRRITRWKTAARSLKQLVFRLTNVNHKNPEMRDSIQTLMRLIYYVDPNVNPLDFTPEQPNITGEIVTKDIAMNRVTTDLRLLNENEKIIRLILVYDLFKVVEGTKDFVNTSLDIAILIPHEYALINEGEPRILHIADELQFLLTRDRFDGLGYFENTGLQLSASGDGFEAYIMNFLSHDVA